jgi:hypothetical protein
MSLILSLLVALFGILLKQWIRIYIKWTEVTPERDAIALREYRYIGLEAGGVSVVLTILPVLLQVAVILFLVGLLIFLWGVNQVVAKAMIALGGVSLFLVGAVTALPIFWRTCPYKSPLSELLISMLSYLTHYAHRCAHNAYRLFCPVSNHVAASLRALGDLEKDQDIPVMETESSWREIDQKTMTSKSSTPTYWQINALSRLCCTTQSEHIWGEALACLSDDVMIGDEEPPKSTGQMNVCWSVVNHVLGQHNIQTGQFEYRTGLLHSERLKEGLIRFCVATLHHTGDWSHTRCFSDQTSWQLFPAFGWSIDGGMFWAERAEHGVYHEKSYREFAVTGQAYDRMEFGE